MIWGVPPAGGGLISTGKSATRATNFGRSRFLLSNNAPFPTSFSGLAVKKVELQANPTGALSPNTHLKHTP